MKLRILLTASLLCLATFAERAECADPNATTFFNGGAEFYISNNIPDALTNVEDGLKIYPDDVKLKELEKLLKQQQQQQQQQQNQQNQQNQQQKNQQNKQNQSQQKQSQNQQSQSKDQQQQQKQEQQRQNQQSAANAQKQQQQQARQARAMTPEDAKRLLDSQKENEQVLQFKGKNQPESANPPLKDW